MITAAEHGAGELPGTAGVTPTVTTLLASWIRGRRIVTTLIGTACVILFWQFVAVKIGAHVGVVPSFTTVIGQYRSDGIAFYAQLAWSTCQEALWGWLIGNVAAVALAMVVVNVGFARKVLYRLAITSYSLPIAAIGPILVIMVHGDLPMEILAGLAVFFVTLVGTMVGLSGVNRDTIDVVRSCGGGKWSQMTKVRCWSALPSIFAALKISAPAAITAAIVGEFMAGRGALGVAMLNSEQQLDIARTWCLTLTGAVMSALAYGVIAVIERVMTSWAGHGGGDYGVATSEASPRASSGRLRQVWGTLWPATVSLAVILVLWQAVVSYYKSVSTVTRGPLAIFQYLFTSAAAAGHQSEVLHPLLTTIRDAGLGYAVGTISGTALALVFLVLPSLGDVLLPYVIAVRTVPLITLTPLLVLVFGHGLVLVSVIGGLVTFFPTLVNVGTGLRAAPQSLLDVIAGFGGGTLTKTLKVRVHVALPLFFAAARLAVPSAIVGAMLAEWFGTGVGLGAIFAQAISVFKYNEIWTAVVLITALGMAAYAVVERGERWSTARYRPLT